MSTVLFKENQRYKDKALFIILGIAIAGLVYGMIRSFLIKETPGAVPFVYLGLALFLGAVAWWLTLLKLKVSITEKNINFKLSPIHLKKHTIPWKNVESCEVVKTSNAAQWAGANVTFSDEKRISVTGRNGLALETKKGEHYFIGVNDVEGLKKALEKASIK